jgi:hypothetical protein
MFRKISIIFIVCILTHFSSSAQMDVTFKPFSKAEIALLDFISLDTNQNLNLTFFEENFRFGVPFTLANGISLLKNKGSLYMQLMGSGRLYQISSKGKSNYQLQRIDSTFHSGANFGSINFFYKDTLFQYGGIGFWKIKDFFTFFSQQTHEWEIYNSNRKIPNYLSSNDGLFYQVNEKTGKLYISHSIHQLDFPNTLTTYVQDSCRVFDFEDRKWENLGMINPALKELGVKGVFMKSMIGPNLIFQADLELYWLNFSDNQFGSIVKNKRNEYREKWLKLYKNQPEYMFQFAMGHNFYLIRIEKDGQLTYETITLNDKDFADFNVQPVYTNSLFASFLKTIEPGRPIIGNAFIVLIVLLLYTFYNKKFKKKKIPQEVQSILYKNFFSSLTIVEKELIQSIYQLQIKNEQISIKTINKIIGVQQKDTITQNKSRSDYFLRINQKFKLATRENDSLIVKQREETDKRQYNYNINIDFIKEIEKLILNN